MVLGIGPGGVSLPSGAIVGQQLGFFLDKLAARGAGVHSFDEFDIPFRAVATNAVTGKMVVFDSGSLAGAMRASMSVPGVFAPAEIGDQLYLDGGIVRNLPIDVVRRMGAEVVIAVNLESPLATRQQLNSALTVTLQMIDILLQGNVNEQLATLKDTDVLILPDLNGYSSASFDQAPNLIPIGEKAARAIADKLRRYSLPEKEYLALREEQRARYRQPAAIQRIRVNTAALRFVNPEWVVDGLQLDKDQPVDIQDITRKIDVLYGTGDFERISYGFEYENGERVLVVEPVDKPGGPNYLRFGLRAFTDFKGDNEFIVLGNYTMTWLNRLGAQWRNDIGLGSSSFFRSEFYQPLNVAGPWFVAPSVFVGTQMVNFFEGDAVAAQVRETRAIAALDAGATIGPSAQVRAGVFTGTLHATPTVIIPGVSDVTRGLGRVPIQRSVRHPRQCRFPAHRDVCACGCSPTRAPAWVAISTISRRNSAGSRPGASGATRSPRLCGARAGLMATSPTMTCTR